jgi:3-demethylubiquinone-9 3-methyltransferase
MANSITPFLMFIGTAEEALRFYIGLFDNSSITHIDRYGPGESGVEGSVKTARSSTTSASHRRSRFLSTARAKPNSTRCPARFPPAAKC